MLCELTNNSMNILYSLAYFEKSYWGEVQNENVRT